MIILKLNFRDIEKYIQTNAQQKCERKQELLFLVSALYCLTHLRVGIALFKKQRKGAPSRVVQDLPAVSWLHWSEVVRQLSPRQR